MTPLAYYGHHHAHSAGAWLADVAMRGVVYSVINRIMRSMTLAEALTVAGVCVVVFLAFRSRT